MRWVGVRDNHHLSLLRKSLHSLYPPGSTSKPAPARGLLENGVAPTDAVGCTGRYRLGGGYFHCHKRGGHGVVSLNKAIAQSCDIYFYPFCRRIGIARIAATSRWLGPGVENALPAAFQPFGSVHDPAGQEQQSGHAWQVREAHSASIRNGFVPAIPLKLPWTHYR